MIDLTLIFIACYCGIVWILKGLDTVFSFDQKPALKKLFEWFISPYTVIKEMIYD